MKNANDKIFFNFVGGGLDKGNTLIPYNPLSKPSQSWRNFGHSHFSFLLFFSKTI